MRIALSVTKLARSQLVSPPLAMLLLVGLIARGAKVEKHPEFTALANNRGAKVAEVCKPRFSESISVVKSSENENPEFTSGHQRKLFFIQRFSKLPEAFLFDPRAECATALVFEWGGIWPELGCARFCESKRVNKSEIVCGSLSPISYITGGLDERIIGIDYLNVAHEHVGAQFSLAVFLCGFPEQVITNKQSNREEGHYESAERANRVSPFVQKFKNAEFIALVVFLFVGPLIGFGLAFLNKWLGFGVMISWWLFLVYLSSGILWDAREGQKQREKRNNHAYVTFVSSIEITSSKLQT
jgi:hypothetical protein